MKTEEEILMSAKNYIRKLFRDNADGHDAGHTLRVHAVAKEIADAYPESDRFVVELAALLHDADDHKLFHTENNANARSFLEEQGVNQKTVEQICAVISGVSFSKNREKVPETLEGKIVQDADRIDALGAIGIARTFAFGGRAGRSLTSSRDHFDEKLFLLKDRINTEEGRKIAEKRHAFMKAFIEEYDKETA